MLSIAQLTWGSGADGREAPKPLILSLVSDLTSGLPSDLTPRRCGGGGSLIFGRGLAWGTVLGSGLTVGSLILREGFSEDLPSSGERPDSCCEPCTPDFGDGSKLTQQSGLPPRTAARASPSSNHAPSQASHLLQHCLGGGRPFVHRDLAPFSLQASPKWLDEQLPGPC